MSEELVHNCIAFMINTSSGFDKKLKISCNNILDCFKVELMLRPN